MHSKITKHQPKDDNNCIHHTLGRLIKLCNIQLLLCNVTVVNAIYIVVTLAIAVAVTVTVAVTTVVAVAMAITMAISPPTVLPVAVAVASSVNCSSGHGRSRRWGWGWGCGWSWGCSCSSIHAQGWSACHNVQTAANPFNLGRKLESLYAYSS